MIVTSVCRLCMSEKELRWVFDEGITSGSDMKTIIFITTGVEILQNDIISQKICSNCFKLTGKMFEFRERAVKTDKYLKDQCKNAIQNHEIADTERPSVIAIKSKNDTQNVSPVNNENEVPKKATTITHEINPSLVTPEKSKSAETMSDTSPEFSKKKAKKKVHKSIEEIFVRHSEVKLPSSCLRLDVNPSVNLEMDFVEDYFRRNKQDMRKYVQHALRSNRASKKTLPVKQKKTIIKANDSSIEDNRRIVEENKPGMMKHPDPFKVSPISIRLTNIPSARKSTDGEDNDDNDNIVKSFKSIKRRRISDSSTETESIKQPTLMESSMTLPTLTETSIKQPTLMETSLEQPTLMETSLEQPTLMETLQLKPKENAFVHRCTICNCLQLSAKALKVHFRTHFKCTYCKKRFKLFIRKEEHDNKCAIKFCLTRPVFVKLEKIDATKYLSQNIKNELQKTAIKTLVPIQLFQKTDAIGIQVNSETFNDEIIELSDDDSEPPTSEPSVAACTSKSTDSPATFQLPLNNDLPKLIHIAPPLNTSVPVLEQSQCTGTSIVKPSIHIKDNCVLNAIDTSVTDIKVLKQLLSSSPLNNLKLFIEDETQTNIPSNDEVRYANQVAAFKNLYSQLYSYKIPINIKKGDFKVSYDKNQKCEPSNKKPLADWSHTKPITNTKYSDFNIENFNKHILLGIPLFSNTKQKPCQPTILNHTLISHNFQPPAAPTINTPRPVQNSNFRIINQPAQTPIRQTQSVPQRVQTQTQTNNMLVYNLPQQAQTPLINVQAHSVPQPVQIQTSNVQSHSLPQIIQSQPFNVQAHNVPQTKISNIQVRNLPNQVQTGNIQAHNLPQQVQTTSNIAVSMTRQIQSNLQSLTASQEKPTSGVHNHVLPAQNLQYQIHNMPQQTSSGTIPISSSMFTLNSNSQNIQQTPIYTTDVQNLSNYFLNANNTVILPVTNSTASLNSTITSNNQGSINTNENTLSIGHIQSNPPVSITPVTLTNNAASTSSHLLVRNNQNNFVVNSSYPSSASKTPPLNVNPFDKTTASTLSGINTFTSTSTDSQRNTTTNIVASNTDIHKPMIRVRNIFELT